MAVDGRLIAGISILVAVVEGGSFTRAGELLGLSASGVSRAITRLEERVGVRLLDRTTRTLRLTDEGSRLYELATPHLEGVEEATAIARGAAASVRGMLRVSANPIFARHILAPHLSEFIARYPDLRLTILQQSDVGDLIGGGIDVAIRFGPQPPSTISSRHLLDTRVLTVASPDYLAGRGRPGSPADLAGHQCLEFIDPRSGQVFEWEFHKDGDILPVMKAGALDVHRRRYDGSRLSRGDRHCAGAGARRGETAGERRPGRAVSGLARRDFPALRGAAISSALAGEGDSIHRLLHRDRLPPLGSAPAGCLKDEPADLLRVRDE
jgi:DNA-binding transcriptional LysR family regulator